jgi:hypothetical protein
MYPHLSQAAKAREAADAKWRAEMKERSRRTAENLQSVLDSLRKEREG